MAKQTEINPAGQPDGIADDSRMTGEDPTRRTEHIHEDIIRATTTLAQAADLAEGNAELGRLWREMARAADRDRERTPAWAVLAAALLADDYDRRAKGRA